MDISSRRIDSPKIRCGAYVHYLILRLPLPTNVMLTVSESEDNREKSFLSVFPLGKESTIDCSSERPTDMLTSVQAKGDSGQYPAIITHRSFDCLLNSKMVPKKM